MNENKNTSVKAGLCFSEVLGVVFIILKLCGVINWSWFWVTFPLWAGFAASIVIIGIIFLVVAIKCFIMNRRG